MLIALSNTAALFFNDGLAIVNLSIANFQLFDIDTFPYWARLLVFFVIIDFVQWFTHTLLHKYQFLWNFHKVHHSVKQMGFAAHLRYHWMETIVYRTIEYIPLAMIGIGLNDFFIIHIFINIKYIIQNYLMFLL